MAPPGTPPLTHVQIHILMGLGAMDLLKLMQSYLSPMHTDMVAHIAAVKEPEACRYMVELVDGVDRMHLEGVIHTDLKLGNVVVDAETGRLRIIDLGFAAPVDPSTKRARYDIPIKWLPNLQFNIAPELHPGWAVEPEWQMWYAPNHLVDVWSLGCILFELLHGVPPFPVVNAVNRDSPEIAALRQEFIHPATADVKVSV